jgi:cell surface protein SprA
LIGFIRNVNIGLLKKITLMVFWIFFSVEIIYAQKTFDLGKISLKTPISIIENYTYNPETGLYIFSKEIGGYQINAPLVLTVKEFQAMVLKDQMKSYFQNKTRALSGKSTDLKNSQKNLLPELYVNNDFFQSIFGGNTIDISPQGSIGIDLGVRYQKNDNPAASPRDRENFGFDFDQRISLSLLGNIGKRLQINANYDTESTFDFQNIIKIQFNPPNLSEVGNIIPSKIGQKINNLVNLSNNSKNSIEEARNKIQSLKENINKLPSSGVQVGNRVSDYLKGKVTDDAILQNIDIGNISMPINSNLIQGAQSLFGVRADLKFGKTTVSGIFSEQRSQSQNIIAQGGGKIENFEIFALDYEEDRHYFLSQYFRDHYDESLSTYPYINSPVQITRIEVWVTNRGAQTQNVRNIIAIQDLAEANPTNTKLDELIKDFFNVNDIDSPPNNDFNRLNPDRIGQSSILNQNIRDIAKVKSGFGILRNNIREGYDYTVLESARKLNPKEFNYHAQLGYISLNQRLSNDEVLGVAFQYTFLGRVYQVGEFANGDIPGTSLSINANNNQQETQIETNNLVVKMLKSSITDVNQPVWNLMMKNIYSIGAFELSEEGFRFNILYTDPSPINYISPIDKSIWPDNLDKQILLNTFALDRLNVYEDIAPKGDGFFDYIPGITIDPKFGRIIFPKVEPFGEFLFKILENPNSSIENYNSESTFNQNQKKYVFKEMYSLTKAGALESSEKNKFQLKGKYKSEGGDGIAIGSFNVPRGSVQVSAGGRFLQEGIDYIVNYEIGRVKIIDEGLKASNIPIKISLENNTFFNQQNKRFSGINILHRYSEKISLGATMVNLSENPLTQKANYGMEPVNNTMIGFNTNFSTESTLLTRLINLYPTVNTSVPSQISFRGEIASLRANNPRNTQLNGETNVYIDDFEGAQTNIDIKGFSSWNLSSVPSKYFKGSDKEGIESGEGRSKLAWYTIDPIFYGNDSPQGINNNEISNNKTRRIFIKEIFPEKDLVQGSTTVQNTFDLAYYPDEKGPYNNSLTESYGLNPDENWAGIMRPLSSTNFEQSNVEFIEFWLLDTFSEIESMDENLGYLVFHLGNISEDILRDGRKQFENGLPGLNDNNKTYSTPWGKVPSSQSLLYAFNTEEADRTFQDSGLDGILDEEEQEIYSNGPSYDPAGDNYNFYIQAEGDILERYKNYNGTQGNTPIGFTNNNRGNTTEPDTEDINRDQTMNTIESYFEYRVPITKSMTVGNHPFISDVRENVKVNTPNGDEISTKWIQFKVPIQKNYYENTTYKKYFESINSINDLRSIRFMRMIVSDFKKDVVFRFGTLDLVRGDWRTYNKNLNEEILPNFNTTIDISTVNILENENRIPINYVLPPEIQREQINNNNSIIRQNEQSLSFRISNLEPRDSRGIYKTVDLDLRQYNKLRMFLHAESLSGHPLLPGEGINDDFDNRLVAFIRLGTDYKDNYYQIEIPLKPSEYIKNSGNNLTAEEVWNPDSNSLDISVDLLLKLKAAALEKLISGKPIYFDEELNFINEFTPISSLPGFKKYKLSIKGNPSLASIKTIMIGVKNPSIILGNQLSGEVWFNELRISGINSTGGWSAIGSLDANIADFADISTSGRYSTSGFGSIDQSPNQRNNEDIVQYDIVSNFNLGQLVPKKWGLELPLNYSLGETIITPEYDPFYQDLKLNDRLSTAQRSSQRDSIKDQARTYIRRKSINFIGIRKLDNGSSKKQFYSIENFDFSYAFNEKLYRDYEISKQNEKLLQLGSNYGYSFNPINIEFFKNLKLSDSEKPYWQWLKEINFNLLPNSISISSNINRALNSQRFREVYLEGVDASKQLSLPELQQQNFLFDWTYSINHNLTKSLRFTFNSSTSNIVRNEMDEPSKDLISKPKEIWDGIWNTGEPNRHFQSLSLNYKIPFRLIPVLKFIDANYNYTGDFSWQRGSRALANVKSGNGTSLGIVNQIQNANTKSISGAISFKKLYSILGIENNQENSISISETNKNKYYNKLLKNSFIKVLDLLSSISRVQFNYTENNGTVLPGYLPSIGFAGSLKPSLGFVFGSQADIRYEAARQGWLTDFPNFNQPIAQVHNNKLTYTGQFSPLKGLIIDFNAEKNYSKNINENYFVDQQEYIVQNSNIYGNYGISTLLIRTAFDNSDVQQYLNFRNFRNYRSIIADRLFEESGLISSIRNDDEFPSGYGKNHQSVIIQSFLAAYTGTDPNKISLNPVKNNPIPNWNLKYTGLMNIKSLKKIFNRFSITHAYRASYTLNNFQTNFNYDIENPLEFDKSGNIIPEILYSNVNLVEQFNPVMRLDIEFKNSLKILMELKKDRALSLSLDNNLLTESTGDEYIVGVGYRLKDLRFRTSFGGKRTTLKGDLNIKADLSYRNNITVLRNLEYENNQVTAGQKLMSLKITADYALSKNITSLFFYDHNFSKFAISTAFPQASIRSGITIRYNFGN